MRHTILAFVGTLVLAACSAKPVITNVSLVDAGTTISGVPMRIKTEQIVHIFRFNPEQDQKDLQFTEVSSSHQVLADPNRLFAVDVVSAPFSSPGLHVTENPDNTLKSIQTTSTENQAGAVDAATQALTGVTTARNAAATACQSTNTAAVTADQAAASARASYDQLPATATPQLRAAYQAVIASAQKAADYAHAAPPCH
jgi:hypothetical protein